MSKNYLESYLEKDDLAMYIYQREIGDVILLRRLASMTDEELGKWFTDQERPKDELIDVIAYVGEKRLALALSYASEEDLADILNNVSLDLLIDYDEIDNGSFGLYATRVRRVKLLWYCNEIKKIVF